MSYWDNQKNKRLFLRNISWKPPFSVTPRTFTLFHLMCFTWAEHSLKSDKENCKVTLCSGCSRLEEDWAEVGCSHAPNSVIARSEPRYKLPERGWQPVHSSLPLRRRGVVKAEVCLAKYTQLCVSRILLNGIGFKKKSFKCWIVLFVVGVLSRSFSTSVLSPDDEVG